MGIFISNKRYLDLLCELKITPNQFFQLYCVYMKDWASALRFAHEVKPLPTEEADDLVKRGLLLNLNKPGEYYADCYAVSDEAATRLFVDLDQAGQEFWDDFPDYIIIKDQQVPAKSVDFDDLVAKYVDNIANNPIKHRRVLKLLEHAKASGLITMGIDKWVRSRQWEALEKIFGDSSPSGEVTPYGEREV